MQSLAPLMEANQLKRGAVVLFTDAMRPGSPQEAMVEFVKENYLVLSFLRKSDSKNLYGSTIRIDVDTQVSTIRLQLEVISEQVMWPVTLIGLFPVSVDVIVKEGLPLVKPDFIINVPYKVMGAKPLEERGEGVLLEFSPEKLVIGTDGFVSKGDYVQLQFLIPRTKEQLVAMAHVDEKTFADGSTVVTLHFTDLEAKYAKKLQEYYHKLRGT